MSENLTIHSFGRNDRSGKIRWLAYELGLPVVESRVELGEHRQFPYRDLNPYGAIPSIEWRDQTLIESTAVCTYVAEQFPDAKMIVSPDEPERFEYLKWLAVCSDTLESKLVDYYLSTIGLAAKEVAPLLERTLKFKLRVFCEQLPTSGFVVANRFTLADISIGYCLRLAIDGKLIEREAVAGYLEPLVERDSAQQAGIFRSLMTEA